MSAEFDKKMRIADDLLSFCHIKGASEYHLDIAPEGDATVFKIKAEPVSLSGKDLATLRQTLNTPRQREIEQDYWELGGDSESFSELMLVGMMSDEAGVEYDGNVLFITLKRLP